MNQEEEWLRPKQLIYEIENPPSLNFMRGAIDAAHHMPPSRVPH